MCVSSRGTDFWRQKGTDKGEVRLHLPRASRQLEKFLPSLGEAAELELDDGKKAAEGAQQPSGLINIEATKQYQPCKGSSRVM